MTMDPRGSGREQSQRFAVRVEAPARLHFGFVDVSGTLGRRFGSLGLTIEDFSTVLELRRAERFAVRGPQSERAANYLRRLLDDHDPAGSASLDIARAIPEHVGLGSGTQLALAVGTAFAALFDLPLQVQTLAARLDRGARSGIGIGAFDFGGFIVDGGRTASGGHPPVIARLPFPVNWRVLLVFDRGQRGVFGEAERAAFRALHDFPRERAAHLAHLVLMRLMPALAEEDFESFSAAVGEIQRTVGDYFAAAQGGRYASAVVEGVLGWLEDRGIVGVGQTSWGPTGFAMVDSEVRAHALLIEARERFSREKQVEFALAQGRNRGSCVSVLDAAQASSAAQSLSALETSAELSVSDRAGGGSPSIVFHRSLRRGA
jgi:beta-RFAP synthase